MGAYLSEPVTEKISQDGFSEKLSFGVSSMQGWRRTQEDAHNCIINFDKDSSCFAVYDGHGGDEVAKYCALHLPSFLQSLPEYAEGNMTQALEDAFLEFDATLTKPEVIVELKQIAGRDVSDSEKEDTEALAEEAKMPLEELLARYQGGAVPMKIAPHLRNYYNEKPKSPKLRAKKDNGENEDAALDKDDSDMNEEESADGPCDSGKAQTGDKLLNGDDVWDSDKEITCDSTTDVKLTSFHVNKSKKEQSSLSECEVPENVASGHGDQVETSVRKCDSVQENDISESICVPDNGNFIDDKGASCSREGESSVDSSTRKEGSSRATSDISDSSEDDEDYDESESDSDTDDYDEEEEGEDEGGEEDDEDDYYPRIEVPTLDKEEPGLDSGCTAVLAVIKGNELYVANAGDSRCVVCRDGKALEMSTDHKPEDEVEKNRIERAGGDVTQDGRVNGGLNLSRAIGDHSYKMSKHLSPREQMITALPEIKMHTFDSNDDFMVLACDGIWNYMSSQEVIDYVKERISNRNTLSSICEELFDHCLAPSTKGDGTGCDNMTCIIIKFNHPVAEKSCKRPASEIENSVESGGSSGEKRIKLSEEDAML